MLLDVAYKLVEEWVANNYARFSNRFQAMSHCVRYTMSDLADKWPAAEMSKLVLLVTTFHVVVVIWVV